ncbi:MULTISPECIES: OmpH family outer membrane protein [unclassified Tenacibaculum]|uniref:OmpH family outer membrane protein n=1 Tax=unclassified Tenacibaculum TaxID=2635139 RepID=UPI001F3F33DA|nr:MULTISPECIES: OmpH family outer membrane protein [unclassified Tenacibaculum]MCF2874238.1 OmpH family outer membrane protein [Tenacibaculum sp. Cn5-1]MCF2934819.1 OmpH family outer membrane protein [Tenacibaculum sp. Cn5-34]MCG7511029.1 OmpH family outer membrane protein [Tenacibaculum sp. Cn5-46]
MKFKFILFTITLFTTLSYAQTKVGTVNSDYIIGKMPQMKNVIRRVENYGKKLDSSFQLKAKEYQTKIEAYKTAEKTLSEEDKKTKVQEIATLEQEIGNFRQNGAKLLQLQRDDNMRPLYKKLSEVIAEVAKANGYTQILTTNGNQFGYIDKRYDITKLVLEKLGIKE